MHGEIENNTGYWPVGNHIPNPVPLNATPMANALLYRICVFSTKPELMTTMLHTFLNH